MESDSRPAGGPLATEALSAPSLGETLRAADRALSGVSFGRLTAEALLAYVLGISRAQVLARLEQPFPPRLRPALESLIARAAEGEPLAYLTGRREFCGLDFSVDGRVLVPRPETEQLAERGLQFLKRLPARPGGWRVFDVGTGSGNLAITLAVKCATAKIIASDISAEALVVARANAVRHQVAGQIVFVQSDLLSAFRPRACDLLVANLPYIPSATLRSLAVSKHEPPLALDGGPDGLELYRRLLADAPRVMEAGGQLLLEIEDTRGRAARELAQAAFPHAHVALHPDLAGLDRVVDIAL